jgi:hypothetical protein
VCTTIWRDCVIAWRIGSTGLEAHHEHLGSTHIKQPSLRGMFVVFGSFRKIQHYLQPMLGLSPRRGPKRRPGADGRIAGRVGSRRMCRLCGDLIAAKGRYL